MRNSRDRQHSDHDRRDTDRGENQEATLTDRQ